MTRATTDNMWAMTIGARVLQERTRRGLSQQALAAAACVSQSAVKHLERGRHNPSFGTVAALATALNVSLDWLAWGRK